MTNKNNEIMPVPQGMDVRDADNHPLMELRAADTTLFSDETQEQELDSHSIAQFNHFLAAVPSTVSAIAGNSKQLMTCSFDYSKLIQVKDGSGAIGTVYKEGTSLFGAQARFHEAKTLQSAVNTGLLLNIASQVVAQKHLADINERLQAIEAQVKGIHKFLEQSRSAKIQAFQEHLQRIGTMLANEEEVSPDTLQVLAVKVQDVRPEVVHIRRDLETAQKEINDFDKSSWFGSNDLRVALQEKIKRISHLQREYLLGIQSLLVANLILYIKHGGNKEFMYAGQKYLEELEHEHGLRAQWDAIKRRVSVYLSKMKPLFELAKSTQANVQLVESSIAKTQRLIDQDATQIRQLQQRIVDAQTPRTLLEVENGRVARGRYLQ